MSENVMEQIRELAKSLSPRTATYADRRVGRQIYVTISCRTKKSEFRSLYWWP